MNPPDITARLHIGSCQASVPDAVRVLPDVSWRIWPTSFRCKPGLLSATTNVSKERLYAPYRPANPDTEKRGGKHAPASVSRVEPRQRGALEHGDLPDLPEPQTGCTPGPGTDHRDSASQQRNRGPQQASETPSPEVVQTRRSAFGDDVAPVARNQESTVDSVRNRCATPPAVVESGADNRGVNRIQCLSQPLGDPHTVILVSPPRENIWSGFGFLASC